MSEADSRFALAGGLSWLQESWHPDLVTFYVWVRYPSPDGIFAGVNPLTRPLPPGLGEHTTSHGTGAGASPGSLLQLEAVLARGAP